MHIEGVTILDVWKKSVNFLLSKCELVPTDRNLDTYEFENVVLKVTKPLDGLNELFDFEKKRHKDYYSKVIKEYWDNIYKRLKKYMHSSRTSINQFDEIKSKLKSNPYTRHAYISIWSPFYDLKDQYPACLIGLYFVIRNEKLNMTAILRSNDSWGQALNDMYELVMIQDKMAKELGIDIGIYSHFAMSYLLYTKDKVEAIMILKGK